MASAKELAAYALDQLSGLPGVRARAMMGGYIFYIQDRVFGGIYEPGFLVKDVPAARAAMPDSEPVRPVDGENGAPMLPVTILDDREALCAMVAAMLPELPERKARGKRTKQTK